VPLFYPKLIEISVAAGSLNILKYINDHIYKINEYPIDLSYIARRSGQDTVLRWLISIGIKEFDFSGGAVLLTNIIKYISDL